MMRRFGLVGLALMTTWFAVGCDDSTTSNVIEPAFGRVDLTCDGLQVYIGGDEGAQKVDLLEPIDTAIEELFDSQRSVNGAKTHVNNIIDAVCAYDYAAAEQYLHTFIQQVQGQPADKLNAFAEDWAQLVTFVILLASDPADVTIAIPAGAFEDGGALAIVDPATFSGPVFTRNGKAAVIPGDLPDQDPFIVALGELPQGFSFPGFATSPGYEVVTDADVPNKGFVVMMCVSGAEALPPGADLSQGLLIAHESEDQFGNPVADLLPRIVDENFCLQGAQYAAGPGLLDGAPAWLRRMGSLAGNLVRKTLLPEPLHARFFAETGLGGRTKVFSPFAPVNPTVTITPAGPFEIEIGEARNLTATFGHVSGLQSVSWTSSQPGVVTLGTASTSDGFDSSIPVTGAYQGTTTITVTYTVLVGAGIEGAEEEVEFTDEVTVTVLPPIVDLIVEVENLTPYEMEVMDGAGWSCSPGTRDEIITCEPKQAYRVGTHVTLTAAAFNEGVPLLDPATGDILKRHDFTFTGMGCEDKLPWPRNGEETAFCTFRMVEEMADGTPPTIHILLTH